MTEDQLEQEAVAWLVELGYEHRFGPDIAHDGPTPERSSYRQVVLPFRLREAVKVTMRKSCGFRTFRITEIALCHVPGKLPEPELTHRFY